jgi:hypothetical protein
VVWLASNAEFSSSGIDFSQLKTVEIQSNSREPKHLIIFAGVENEQIELKIKNDKLKIESYDEYYFDVAAPGK